MQTVTVFLLGLGLSADACAVSLTSGLMIRNLKLYKALKIALFFGVFQAGMVISGWGIGLSFRELIAVVGSWIAFGLLSLLGGKMIYEAVKEDDEDEEKFDPLDNTTLTALAIATSLDALAAGISLSVLKVSIFSAGAIIGLTTFSLCLLAVFLGHKCGHLWKNQVEILGGVVLIAIGLKIILTNF